MAGFSRAINIADIATLARKRLPRAIVDFVDGGAEDECTIARNHAAFGEWALVPGVVKAPAASGTVLNILGQSIEWPFIVAPTGMPGLLHPGAEIAVARAAANVGAAYCLSTMSTASIEDVASATRAPKMFQLYLFRDRGLSREMIQRARAAGYSALILTMDVQTSANRERDRRNGMIIPPRLSLRTLSSFAWHPRWCWNAVLRGPMRLANFEGIIATPGVPLLQFIDSQFDRNLSWKDVAWVAREWGGPLAVKGIMASDDAIKACDHGAGAIIVSNHGGRQLDGCAAPLDALPDIVELVGDRTQIILDGGVRRGTDMLKAIALGADACMSGRIGLWGLAAGGECGAAAAFRILRDEYRRDLALLGVTSTTQIRRTHVVPLRPCAKSRHPL